jgi:structural maintenance of chromosome 4
MKRKEREIADSLQEQNRIFQTAKLTQESTQNDDQIMKLLQKVKRSGSLSGMHGRLCDLGTIDNQYDVAISSAFGDRLKQIVVDDVKTAEECIRILKEQSAGRATFIVLDRASSIPATSNTPENAPRLIDLVKPREERYRKAFYNVLRDTLVANDLSQANRIAFGKVRWKVVTLDGKVIDRSGTMSGGGNRVAKGALSGRSMQEVDAAELKRMELQVSNLEASLAETRSTMSHLQSVMEQLTTNLSTSQSERKHSQMSLKHYREQLEDMDRRIRDLE